MGIERVMCIALYVPNTRSISKDRLKRCYQSNPDGCGFMWSCNDNLYIRKGCWTFDEFYSLWHLAAYKIYPNSGFVIHFRTATSGKKEKDKCHPFRVNDNLAFVHNGNLFEFSESFPAYQKDEQSLSDTQGFNRDILQKLPDGFLNDVKIKNALEGYCISNFSKMIFMDNKGHVNIINEQAGQWEDGIFYSNGGIEDYTGYGYSGAYKYNSDDVRHKGGLISITMFSEERRENWQMCEICKGWFKKDQLTNSICNGCYLLEGLKKWYTGLQARQKRAKQNWLIN